MKLFQQKPSKPSKTSEPHTLATPKNRKAISDCKGVLKPRHLYWSHCSRVEKGRSLPLELSRALEEAPYLFAWDDEYRGRPQGQALALRFPKRDDEDDDAS